MKTLSPLLLCLCAVLLASPSNALADDTTSSDQNTASDGSDSGTTTAQKIQRMRAFFAQLDLTDDQKQQIKQIRQSVSDPIQRRQQVMAVLTPEQKQKLMQLIQRFRSNGGASEGDTSVSGGNGSSSGSSSGDGGGVAGNASDLAPGAN